MDKTAGAVADIRISLEVAASAYAAFAEREDVGDASRLLEELSFNRRSDASQLARAALSHGLEPVEPTLDTQAAAEFIGIGRSAPPSGSSAGYRVQRAENTLSTIVTQLLTSTPYTAVQNALGSIRENIAGRRRDVRAMRQQIHSYASLSRFHVGTDDSGYELASSPTEKIGVPGEEVEIWFGTNRERNTSGKFTSARGRAIQYGRCRVFIPQDRKLGGLGSGFLGRLLNGDDRVKIKSTEILPSEQFWSDVSNACASLALGERQALVFLHGYRTKFEDAARRTGQLKADLQHRGPAAFFAWPSHGVEYGYPGDEAAIDGSALAIRPFLTDFAVRSGAEAVHIIAHSMGNRALLRAMDAIARDAASASQIRFGQLILAAPDVDTDLFQDLASSYAVIARRSTLYVSENDLAIGASRFAHGAPRVGRAPPVVVVSGIDTVNVSSVNLGLIGHGYASEMRPVLSDMHELIARDTPPDRRFGLQAAGGPGTEHWTFKA